MNTATSAQITRRVLGITKPHFHRLGGFWVVTSHHKRMGTLNGVGLTPTEALRHMGTMMGFAP